MGNRQNKHKVRRFASLPEQQFLATNTAEPSKSGSLAQLPNGTTESGLNKWKVGVGGSLNRLFRNSRRNISQSTLDDQFGQSKTNWPVPHIESLFLPEFPIKAEVDDSDFQIMGIVGRGAFGNVLKCRKIESEDDKVYAMKVLKKAQIIAEGAVKQCKDEVTIQSKINHPFIVRTYHYWQSRKSLYIVMDFVPCGEMFTLWREQGAFPENYVQLVIFQMALGLEYLHNAGVIYRDLKMENVLLDALGHIHLIDFGLAKWLKKGYKTRTICGTLQYMAPELLVMQPYSHAVDWWSLGIMMYALLLGEFPVYGADDHHQMASKVARCRFILPQAISDDARDAVRGLLSKDPIYRIRGIDELMMEPFFRQLSKDQILQKVIIPKDLMPPESKQLLEDNARFADAADYVDNDFPNFEWSASVVSLPAIYV